MHRTRLSLFYLAGYLIPTGLGLMFAPSVLLALLFSNGSYGDIMPRMTGVMMFALGVLVAAMIRFRAEALYPYTVLVRILIWIFTAWLWARSGDPMFGMILGVVGLGILLTGGSYLSERGR